MIELHKYDPNVSPFYVVLLLWYPCFENLFSIIRKFSLKKSPINADNNHLHQLIFIYLKNYFEFITFGFFGGLRIFGNEGSAGKSSAAGALDWLVGRLDPDHGGFGRHLALGSSLACS